MDPLASTQLASDDLAENYTKERIAHWNMVAWQMQRRHTWGAYYHQKLIHIYRQLIPKHRRILEIGCGDGNLLAALDPSSGLGIDFSPEMISLARHRHPELDFLEMDALHLENLSAPFDAVILCDTINDLWDIQKVLENIQPVCGSKTRLVISFYSRLWQLPLSIGQGLNIARKTLPQNWLTFDDIANLLQLAGFEPIRHWREIIFPFRVPLVEGLANKFLVKLWPLSHLALTNFMVARPKPETSQSLPKPSVSVVVPARNEAGNIEKIFQRMPKMGSHTEIVFIEGHSNDDTYQVIEQQIQLHPEQPCQLHKQTGTGKGDAARLGFEVARGDMLMILDADLTVSPQDLSRFYDALVTGQGDFINGVRLVYPMEKQAMRWANFLGNKFFSIAFSWLLGQPIKDTLCGTKALWACDYETIAENRSYFGDFDPFGDFDLLFGAARLNLKIVDMPIRYRERVYGTTNIQRWKHGWLLLKMVIFAALRLKFV